MANLERRIEALEATRPPERCGVIIISQLVEPGRLEPDNRYASINGATYQRTSAETLANFEARVLGVAHQISEGQKLAVMMFLSETPFEPTADKTDEPEEVWGS
jgi:hypothetical protein